MRKRKSLPGLAAFSEISIGEFDYWNFTSPPPSRRDFTSSLNNLYSTFSTFGEPTRPSPATPSAGRPHTRSSLSTPKGKIENALCAADTGKPPVLAFLDDLGIAQLHPSGSAPTAISPCRLPCGRVRTSTHAVRRWEAGRCPTDRHGARPQPDRSL